MRDNLLIRAVQRSDFAEWRPLWDAYNAFYGRTEDTALPDEITTMTWSRFFDTHEPMHALVADNRDICSAWRISVSEYSE